MLWFEAVGDNCDGGVYGILRLRESIWVKCRIIRLLLEGRRGQKSSREYH